MTSLNWSIPSLCRCANFAMSRCVKVDCCCVIASSAREGFAMIRAPLPRAISRCISARSAAFDPFTLDTLRGRTDLVLRLQRDALRLKAAMIDARVDIEFRQALIGKFGPTLAPALDHLRAVPVPHLWAKTVLVHRAHGQHDMGMGFGHAVFADIPVHVEIGDHAPDPQTLTARSRGRVRCPVPRSSRGEGRIRPRGQVARPF